MVNWKQDVVLSLVLLILSGIFYYAALGYPEDVALFPSYLSPLLAFLSFLLLFSALRRRHADQGQAFFWQKYKKIALVTVCIFVYALAIVYVGYISASIVLVGLFFLCMHYAHRTLALIIAVSAAVLAYTLFAVVLEVPLPTGLLFSAE